MASQRPTFARNDTDMPMSDLEKSGGIAKSASPNGSLSDDPEVQKGARAQSTGVDSTLPHYDAREDDHFGEGVVVETAKDVVTHVLHVDDDPSLNPWTFRAYFLGK